LITLTYKISSLKQTIKRKKKSDGERRLGGKFVGVNIFTYIAFVMRLQNLTNWLLFSLYFVS